MPVYHFTYHTHGSWLPDRRQGYVKRHRGILPTDRAEAERYRRQMPRDAVRFSPAQIRVVADEIEMAIVFQRLRLFAYAATDCHAHVLVGWDDARFWKTRRSKLKESITRKLKQDFGKRKWLSAGASRKRVRTREHFDYLRQTYLPGHVNYGKVVIVPPGDPRAVGPRLLGGKGETE